jgi:hypothetical protein
VSSFVRQPARIIAAWLALSALVSLLLASPSPVHAHGSVTPDDDLCVIQIGYARAHFKVYLPARRGHEEYCEDLPEAAETIFVMEYTSSGFDRAPVDFRIIRDVTGLGRFVKWQDVAALPEDDIDAATVFYREPVIEPDVFTVRHEFSESGEFVGVVTARHPDSETMYTAVFPFEVGFTGFGYLPLFLAFVILLQLNYMAMNGWLGQWWRRRQRDSTQPGEHDDND